MIHLSNVFPELLDYSLLAPLIMRVILGLVLLNLGWLKMHKEKNGWVMFMRAMNFKRAREIVTTFGLLEFAGGLMLIVGIYTQPVALAFILLGGIQLFIESKEESLLRRDFVFYLLMTAIATSLLLTGAGLYAVDWAL